jgi:succinate dehydrogenase / fumarate reductase, cytochrome b subunit
MGLQRILHFINSSIGGKIIMALSGAAIIIFLLGHALGNLLIFSSQTSLNTYAHWLQQGAFLWVFRISMLVLFISHIFLAIKVSIQNRTARPILYAISQDIQITYSAKTMLISGAFIFLFIIFHLAHLTMGWVSTTSLVSIDNNQMLDVYNNVVRGFQNPLISLFYIFSILVIGLHLHHGLKSLFQTLGFHNENLKQLLKSISVLVTIALLIAFTSIPLAVLFGYLPEIIPSFIKVVK